LHFEYIEFRSSVRVFLLTPHPPTLLLVLLQTVQLQSLNVLAFSTIFFSIYAGPGCSPPIIYFHGNLPPPLPPTHIQDQICCLDYLIIT
jgi:hypothetical protein